MRTYVIGALAAGACVFGVTAGAAQERAPDAGRPPAQTRPSTPGRSPQKPSTAKPGPASVKQTPIMERLFAAIERRDLPMVRALLQAGADPNLKSEAGLTPLSVAAEAGSVPICELLLERGARIKPDKEAGSPLISAIVAGSEPVTRLLLEHGADPNEAHDETATPVQVAAAGNHVPLIELLITKGAKLDGTALYLAADAGAAAATTALLRHGADPNFHGEDGKTPLMAAAEKGALPVIEALLSKGADVNAKDEIGKTAMMHATGATRAKVVVRLQQAGAREFAPTLAEAVKQGDTRATRSLLANGADANETDAMGRTPLFFAVRNGDNTTVKELLAKGANPNARDKQGRTPMKVGMELGRPEAIQLLIEAGAEAPDWELHEAIQANDLNAIRRALDEGADLESVNERGETALMQTMNTIGQRPNVEVARLLLNRGAKVNATNQEGQTALFVAALSGSLDIAKELLDHGADPKVVDRSGETVLMNVGDTDSEAIIRLLIQHGADLRARSKDGDSVLMNVAAAGDTETLARVLDQVDRSEINRPGRWGSTALHAAAAAGRAGNVKLLLERGADPNAADEFSKNTPLLMVAESEWKEGKDYLGVVRQLLQHGADPNKADQIGAVPLKVALNAGNVELYELLRKSGAKPPPPPKPSALLIEAVRNNDLYAARALLSHGQSANAADDTGYSALVYACMGNNTEMVRLLLAHGAKPNYQPAGPNGFGAPPPLYEAAEKGNTTVIRMLLKSGANINAEFAGSSLLQGAVKEGKYDSLVLLLASGAKLPTSGYEPGDLLGRAAIYSDTRILKLLLQHGVRADARLGNMTPLMMAAQSKRIAGVQILLAAGANPKAVDDHGKTTLMYAAEGGSVELVQLLLAKGVEINARDDQNRTALSLAEDGGAEPVADLLKRAGAKP